MCYFIAAFYCANLLKSKGLKETQAVLSIIVYLLSPDFPNNPLNLE